LLARLRAGCHAPVGAATSFQGEQLVLEAVVLSVDGKARVYARGTGPRASAASLGQEIADQLLQKGADRLIAGL
jgi:hydroxymethylbilane synthase